MTNNLNFDATQKQTHVVAVGGCKFASAIAYLHLTHSSATNSFEIQNTDICINVILLFNNIDSSIIWHIIGQTFCAESCKTISDYHRHH